MELPTIAYSCKPYKEGYVCFIRTLEGVEIKGSKAASFSVQAKRQAKRYGVC